MINTPVCLATITYPGTLYSTKVAYRVVRTTGRAPDLVLERKEKDVMGDPCWVTSTVRDIQATLHEDPRWKVVWAKLAISLGNGRGEILDTREVEYLPTTCRGVVHGYSSRNDHATGVWLSPEDVGPWVVQLRGRGQSVSDLRLSVNVITA